MPNMHNDYVTKRQYLLIVSSTISDGSYCLRRNYHFALYMFTMVHFCCLFYVPFECLAN